VIDQLSSRECAELEDAGRRGADWARALRGAFLEGARLVLGIDRAPSERRVAEAAGLPPGAVGAAMREAARWCRRRGLLLMEFPGGRPEEGRRWLMAVG